MPPALTVPDSVGYEPRPGPVRTRNVPRLVRLLPVMALMLALAAWMGAGGRENQLGLQAAQQLADRSRDMASDRMQRYFDLAMGLGGLLRVGDGLSRREFHDQYETQDIAARFPGVVAVQYAPLVPYEKRALFEALVRNDRSLQPGGYPDFAIHPAGERPFYMPILYNEPMAGNEAAFGFDASSRPELREVQERARDSGRPELSSVTPLVQGGKALLLRYAVYDRGPRAATVEERRGHYRGQIAIVLDGPRLMYGLLPPGAEDWRVRIQDLGPVRQPAAAADLVYDNMPGDGPVSRTATQVQRDLMLGGRHWRITLSRSSLLPWLRPVPLLVLVCGLGFALLLLVATRGLRRNYETVARRAERIRHDALHDFLTGLPNRSYFEKRLRRSLRRAQERDDRMALLFIDLDHFKSINDLHGHAAGDAVLRAVAGRLLATLRQGDTVARLGGDEFVVLLPRARDGTWQLAASRVREAMAVPVVVGDVQLTVAPSIGVAVFPDDGADADTLMRRADGAMYRAKRAGRGLTR